jgi:3D (Asp-Asp-Asp) domain-containing protein
LPFGTKVRIPEIFGNKVFEVQDRMAPKHNGKVDIWFGTREEALKFGVKQSRIEIL